MNINGRWINVATMDNPTLYTSAYLVAGVQGYTKHYYAGSERVSSAIGLGGLENINDPLSIEFGGSWDEKSGSLMEEMNRTIVECLKNEYKIEASLKFLHDMKEAAAGTMDRYFYHPDHLGSSSWITDGSGNAIQHLHYLPFGEDWVDQRNASWSAPYTFSGKEKDVETGYSYFGARYYDSDLSIWLSVDPMSDKYPHQSGYVYCSNSPAKRIDPNGLTDYAVNGTIRTINDGHNDIRIEVSQRQFNKLQKKFDKSGKSYERYRTKLMEKNGYFTFPNSDEVKEGGIDICYNFPKGRGGFRFVDNNNSIPSQENSTNHDVNTIDVTGLLEAFKGWVSTLLEQFGSKKNKLEGVSNNPAKTMSTPEPEGKVYRKSKYLDFTIYYPNGSVSAGQALAPSVEDSIRITDGFKKHDKKIGSKTYWK